MPPDRKAALLRRTTELLSGFENTDGVANAETCRDAARDTHRRALTHRIREIETQIVQLEANTLHNSSDKHIRDMLEDRKSQLKLLRRNMPLTLKGLYERLGLQPPLLSEVKHFKDWIARTGPYNVVVDGLNVAGFNSRGKTDLLKVCMYLVETFVLGCGIGVYLGCRLRVLCGISWIRGNGCC